jgi:hypothetical protein
LQQATRRTLIASVLVSRPLGTAMLIGQADSAAPSASGLEQVQKAFGCSADAPMVRANACRV